MQQSADPKGAELRGECLGQRPTRFGEEAPLLRRAPPQRLRITVHLSDLPPARLAPPPLRLAHAQAHVRQGGGGVGVPVQHVPQGIEAA